MKKLKKFWSKLKYWQKGGIIGGFLFTIFAYFWIFIGLDFACNLFYPDKGDFGCLILIVPLVPAVFVVGLFGDFVRQYSLEANILVNILGYIYATLIYFLQGFILGALIRLIIGKVKKK